MAKVSFVTRISFRRRLPLRMLRYGRARARGTISFRRLRKASKQVCCTLLTELGAGELRHQEGATELSVQWRRG